MICFILFSIKLTRSHYPNHEFDELANINLYYFFNHFKIIFFI